MGPRSSLGPSPPGVLWTGGGGDGTGAARHPPPARHLPLGIGVPPWASPSKCLGVEVSWCVERLKHVSVSCTARCQTGCRTPPPTLGRRLVLLLLQVLQVVDRVPPHLSVGRLGGWEVGGWAGGWAGGQTGRRQMEGLRAAAQQALSGGGALLPAMAERRTRPPRSTRPHGPQQELGGRSWGGRLSCPPKP